MGLLSGLKNMFLGIDEEEYEEDELEAYNRRNYKPEYQPPAAPKPVSSIPLERTQPPQQINHQPKENSYKAPVQKENKKEPLSGFLGNNSSNNSSKKNNKSSSRGINMDNEENKMQVILARPTNFGEVKPIGKDINDKKIVLLNLESVASEDAKRILDFLTGVAFANGSDIKMTAQKTFAIMPSDVKFTGKDLMEELESNGYNFR